MKLILSVTFSWQMVRRRKMLISRGENIFIVTMVNCLEHTEIL